MACMKTMMVRPRSSDPSERCIDYSRVREYTTTLTGSGRGDRSHRHDDVRKLRPGVIWTARRYGPPRARRAPARQRSINRNRNN